MNFALLYSQGEMDSLAAGFADVSTASEVVILFQKLFVEQCILQADSLNQLGSWSAVPGAHPEWFKPFYGLGIEWEKDSPLGTIIGHGGCGPGYTTLVRYVPKYRAIAVILANTDWLDPHPCFYATLKAALLELGDSQSQKML